MASKPSLDDARPSQARYVINRFGKVKDVVEATRFTERQVYHWLRTGSIPEQHWFALICDAMTARVPLTPLDFVAHLNDMLAQSRMTGDRVIHPMRGTMPPSPAQPV